MRAESPGGGISSQHTVHRPAFRPLWSFAGLSEQASLQTLLQYVMWRNKVLQGLRKEREESTKAKKRNFSVNR